MANKWFEETFLPSLEQRMNNPKYPNQMILSERQAMVCEKYMKPTNPDCIVFNYEFGTKHFWMNRAGRYTFLHLEDTSKIFWYVRNDLTNEYIATFDTADEMNAWLDKNMCEESFDIKGMEGIRYTTGMGYKA